MTMFEKHTVLSFTHFSRFFFTHYTSYEALRADVCAVDVNLRAQITGSVHTQDVEWRISGGRVLCDDCCKVVQACPWGTFSVTSRGIPTKLVIRSTLYHVYIYCLVSTEPRLKHPKISTEEFH